jgi:hypothetical protein
VDEVLVGLVWLRPPAAAGGFDVRSVPEFHSKGQFNPLAKGLLSP